MTELTRARNVGTVCLGTVLLGVGCTSSDQDDNASKLSFPEKSDTKPKENGQYPRPSFGNVARKTLVEPPPATIPRLTEPVGPPASKAGPKLRRDLLSSASDDTLIALPDPASPARQTTLQLRPAMPPPPPVAANDVPLERVAGPPLLEQTEQAGTEFLPSAEPQNPSALAAPQEVPVAGETSDAAPLLSSNAPVAELVEPSESAFPEATSAPVAQSLPPAEEAPAPAAKPLTLPENFMSVPGAEESAASPEPLAARPQTPAPAPPPKIEIAEDQTANFAAPAQSAQPAPTPKPTAKAPKTSADDFARMFAGTARRNVVRSAPVNPEPRHARAAEQTTDKAPLKAASSGVTPDAARPSDKPLTLAALVPPPRAPMRIVSTEVPSVDPAPAAPANDVDAPETTMPTSLDEVKSPTFASRPRTTTLGLGGNPAAVPAAESSPAPRLGPDRSASFSASAQPPELTYQDELILELRVKGVDASDTILAYGTRSGVYLPIGTLARILDLAITVSDEGKYASGWVLDEKRTLTIDLNNYRLTIAGKEQPLPRNAAVAFDGELYLLADRIQDFLPIKVETNLRGQFIELETLEPFPFEERMKREADRRRLASRAGPKDEQRFPRQETPYLLASPPSADIELRAVSDNAFGPRGEIDVNLAGDVGFLTAQGFLSADTKNGLTASLISVGREDPDGELLGPLGATAFSAGDISTVSLPLGLRSVAGRGFVATNTPAEAVSVFEQIDLRGVLPDGYEVELYRNDLLIGSTRDTVNGQYEFLQVPVDFGLNIFRLVFFGPQGQRSEEVRRISVGDGRLPKGSLVYRFGIAQKDENVLGVRPPNYIAPRDRGNWRASAEIAYGLTSDITALLSGGWFEPLDRTGRWIGSAGIRTGIGQFAIKADVGAQQGGAFAFAGGVGGQLGASAFTLTHTEFTGDFIDETATVGGGSVLSRSTEFDFNTSLFLGGATGGVSLPINGRARHIETPDGRKQSDAALRTSVRLSGFLASNTLEYSRISLTGLETQSRVFGNFDLATLGRSKTRGRLSVGYRISPDPDLTSASLEVDHAIDENTAIRAGIGYAFESKSTQIGLSAIRDFDRFRLALDGNYGFRDKSYSIGLRLGMSIGYDPLRKGIFLARPGLSAGGAASALAFRDLDGDGLFGPGDTPLPEVGIVAFNQSVETDADGYARLDRLGSGKPISLQVDTATLPDIDLAPAVEGIEIVPRAGRIHAAQFPIIALSEVEGTLLFNQDGSSKGVSGVRLVLRDNAGRDVGFAKTEIDGYFFFERVRPGQYTVTLDPSQSKRLNLCASNLPSVTVKSEADILRVDLTIGVCGETELALP